MGNNIIKSEVDMKNPEIVFRTGAMKQDSEEESLEWLEIAAVSFFLSFAAVFCLITAPAYLYYRRKKLVYILQENEVAEDKDESDSVMMFHRQVGERVTSI